MAIFGKLAYDAGVGVLTLLFVRFAIAAPVLWVAALRRPRRRSPGRRAARCSPRSRSARSATRCRPGLYFAALARMDASLLSMLLYTFPAMVTVAAIALGRETREPPPHGRAARLLRRAGARAARRRRRARFDWLGAALGLGAALTYTAYILVSDRVGGDLEALPLSALITTGAAITFGVAGAATGSLDTGFASEGWVWLAAIAIVSTVTPITLFFAGLRRVGPSTAAILSTLEPPTTVALAFVVFGESLTGAPAGRRRARARRRRLAEPAAAPRAAEPLPA